VVGILLRNFRERAGLTPTQVAGRFGWYGVGKVSKIEAGSVHIPEKELEQLLELYGVAAADLDKMREFGAEARKRTAAGRSPSWSETYEVLESRAAEIKAYQESIMHGLVQTEDYARSLLSMSLTTSPAEVGHAVRVRLLRQQSLTSDASRNFWFVAAEPVLHRLVGGSSVLRGQLERLRELTDLPNVTFQVIPLDRREHVALGTPFTLLRLAIPSFTFAYLEGLTDAYHLDRPPATDIYSLAFDRLRAVALDERGSVKLLERRIRELN